MQPASSLSSSWYQLGCTIYYFGEQEQNRLLVECIAPLVRALRKHGQCRRLWFCRYDARGPHIITVFMIPEKSRAEIEARVSAAVQNYLHASPSRFAIDRAMLEERHRACRGKTQSVVDSYAGLADNNSFVVHEQASEQYPFALARGWRRGDQLWDFVDRLSWWAIERLPAARGAAFAPAVCWLAAFERSLAGAGHAPRGYWRYHAGTLGIDQSIADSPHGSAGILARIGDSNRRNLARLWQQHQAHQGPDPALLVDLVLGDGELAMERRRHIIREVVRVLLLQLGLHTSEEMVIVLYAWLRIEQADEHASSGAGT